MLSVKVRVASPNPVHVRPLSSFCLRRHSAQLFHVPGDSGGLCPLHDAGGRVGDSDRGFESNSSAELSIPEASTISLLGSQVGNLKTVLVMALGFVLLGGAKMTPLLAVGERGGLWAERRSRIVRASRSRHLQALSSTWPAGHGTATSSSSRPRCRERAHERRIEASSPGRCVASSPRPMSAQTMIQAGSLGHAPPQPPPGRRRR